jgi:hypothetical protein
MALGAASRMNSETSEVYLGLKSSGASPTRHEDGKGKHVAYLSPLFFCVDSMNAGVWTKHEAQEVADLEHPGYEFCTEQSSPQSDQETKAGTLRIRMQEATSSKYPPQEICTETSSLEFDARCRGEQASVSSVRHGCDYSFQCESVKGCSIKCD